MIFAKQKIQMNILIKQATIISSSSPFNGTVQDIYIVNGIIAEINANINKAADTVIAHKELHVSIGWMDIFANFGDPGIEYKETIETGAKAAAAGGFTDVMVLPNTNPVVDNKSGVEYILQKAKSTTVNIFPIGAVTKNAEGKELAEMYDMQKSGAIAFSDGTNSIQSAGLLLKALQYVKSFGGTVIQIPDDKTIGTNGLINEGIISTQLGLPGKPIIAEEILVARDIKLARYAESRLHFTGVTSAKSISYIKRGKESGSNISCSVTPYHIYFTDEAMKEYDTNLKVNPPLRLETDRAALIEAIIDGTIDCISSHHLPQNWDNKTCEFEYAKDGMIGLETVFGILGSLNFANSSIGLNGLINLLSTNPRKIFGLNIPKIEEGSSACLTLFNPNESYTFDASMIKSKSKNTPFLGKTLKGKVIEIVNKGIVTLN